MRQMNDQDVVWDQLVSRKVRGRERKKISRLSFTRAQTNLHGHCIFVNFLHTTHPHV